MEIWKKNLYEQCAYIWCPNCVNYKMDCSNYETNDKTYMCTECYRIQSNEDDDEVMFNFPALRNLLLCKKNGSNRHNILRYLIERRTTTDTTYNLTEIYEDLKINQSNYKLIHII